MKIYADVIRIWEATMAVVQGKIKKQQIGFFPFGFTFKRPDSSFDTYTANGGSPSFNEVTSTAMAGGGVQTVEVDNNGKLFAATSASTLYEAATTGLLSGGLVTQLTAQTVQVAAGKGHMVDSWTNPDNPPIDYDFTWVTKTHTPSLPYGAGIRILYVDRFGDVTDVGPEFNPSLRREEIFLAAIEYVGSTIVSVSAIPRVANSTGQTFFDWVDFMGYDARIKGLGTKAVAGVRSVYQEDGSLFQPSANWFVDPTNPNTLYLPSSGDPVTPLEFEWVLSDNTIVTGPTTAITAVYDNGTSSPAPIPSTNARTGIYYLYRMIDGRFFIQPSQTYYDNQGDAFASLSTDLANLQTPPSMAAFVLTAQIVLRKGESDFSDPIRSGIFNLLNGASGGASGGTVVTFDELADTPSTKAGQAKKVCFVDAGEETMAFASNLFWDEVNGRLGVGGATPDGDFELRQQREGDVTGYITNTSPSASARSLLLLRSSAAPSYAGGLILTNDSYTAVPSWASSLIFNTDSGVVGGMKFRAADGDIRFSTSGLEATDLVVDNIGWVGINGSPSHLFDVNGEAHSQATVANLDSAAGSALITKNFFEDKNRYGEMYVDTGGTLTLNIATSTSIANRRVGTNYVQWTNSVNGESFGITPLNGVFTMAADGAGKYEVDVTASFTGVNTTNYFMAIFVNGIIDAGGVQARKVGNGSDLGNMSTQGVVAVSAAQTIDIRFAGDSTGNLIINELNIKIRYIGE